MPGVGASSHKNLLKGRVLWQLARIRWAKPDRAHATNQQTIQYLSYVGPCLALNQRNGDYQRSKTEAPKEQPGPLDVSKRPRVRPLMPAYLLRPGNELPSAGGGLLQKYSYASVVRVSLLYRKNRDDVQHIRD